MVCRYSDSWSSPKNNEHLCTDSSRLIRDEPAEGKRGRKSNVYCSVISLLSRLAVWIMCFSPASFHASASVFFFHSSCLCLSLQRVEVLDACLHKSFHLSAGVDGATARWCCLTMCSRMERKNRVGRGNHRGRGGNGSPSRPAIVYQFSPSVIFVTLRHTLAHAATYQRTETLLICFFLSRSCRLQFSWSESDRPRKVNLH